MSTGLGSLRYAPPRTRHRTERERFNVSVHDPRHSWVMFWRPEGTIARIVYIGPFPGQ